MISAILLGTVILAALVLGATVLLLVAILPFVLFRAVALLPREPEGLRRTIRWSLRTGSVCAALLLATGVLGMLFFGWAEAVNIAGIERAALSPEAQWSLAALFGAGGAAGLVFLALLFRAYRLFAGSQPDPATQSTPR